MRVYVHSVFLYILLLSVREIVGEKVDETKVKGGPDIKDTIEKFLKDLQSKIPEILTFADQNLTIPKNKYVTGTVNLSSISCTGLKEFNATVTYRNFLPLPKSYNFSVENLVLNLDYKSNVTLFYSKYFSLFGEGTASINLKNLIFDGNVSISILPINASTSAALDLDNVLVNVTGLLDDNNFSTDFGEFLGKSIGTIFDANKKVISKTLTETLNFILQEVLTHHDKPSLENILNVTEADLLHIFQMFFNNLIPVLVKK